MHVLGNVWVLWICCSACGFEFGIAGADGGASGAIAGVMGAFLLLYPRARLATVFPLLGPHTRLFGREGPDQDSAGTLRKISLRNLVAVPGVHCRL